jgi:hypothetical protein
MPKVHSTRRYGIDEGTEKGILKVSDAEEPIECDYRSEGTEQ